MGFADKTGVAIHGYALGQPNVANSLGDRSNRSRHSEVRARLGIDQNGCTCVNGVENFDDVLALTFGPRQDGTGIFEVELPLGHRFSSLNRTAGTAGREHDALVLTE